MLYKELNCIRNLGILVKKRFACRGKSKNDTVLKCYYHKLIIYCLFQIYFKVLK